MGRYNLVSVEKNSLWKMVVTDPLLKNKNGSIKAKVYSICDIADKTDNYDWDIIEHKGMIAFKVPTERKTFIYTKAYWNMRCKSNFTGLNILKVK